MILAGRLYLIGLLNLWASAVFAAESPSLEDLKSEVDALRKQLNENQSGTAKPVARKTFDVIVGRYGPNVNVKTKEAKLQIGGLVQVWYQHIQKDNRGLVVTANLNGLNAANPSDPLFLPEKPTLIRTMTPSAPAGQNSVSASRFPKNKGAANPRPQPRT